MTVSEGHTEFRFWAPPLTEKKQRKCRSFLLDYPSALVTQAPSSQMTRSQTITAPSHMPFISLFQLAGAARVATPKFEIC
jgi:hypothetical protein